MYVPEKVIGEQWRERERWEHRELFGKTQSITVRCSQEREGTAREWKQEWG